MLIAVFLASLVGSLHCAGMCGGLVAFTCGSSQRPWLAQVTYHVGRLLAYLSLGALAGWAGSSLDQAGHLLGVQHTAALLSGLLMIVWALAALYLVGKRARAPRVKLKQVRTSAKLPIITQLLTRVLSRVHALPSPTRGAVLGASSGLLPCGWLYAFVVTSAGQADLLRGALVMAAFWAGSVPILVGMGSLVSLLSARARRHIPALSAIVLLVLGLGNIVMRSDVVGPAVPTTPTDTPSSATHCH